MGKIAIIAMLLMLLVGSSSAEIEEAGRYVVKNAKITVMRTSSQGGQPVPETSEELLKIDTATGQVWIWNEVIDDFGSTHTGWTEMKEGDLDLSKK